MKRISRLKELRALSNEDFQEILNTGATRQMIAFDYGVATLQITKEFKRRSDSEVLVGFSLSNEEDLVSKGAWAGSKERYSYVQAGLMSNKSMRL